MAEKEYGITISEALRDREIVLARPFSLLDEQKFEKEFEQEKEKVTFREAASAAFAEESTMSWIYNGLKDTHEPDLNFRLTEDNIKEISKGIPIEEIDFLEDAVSLPHAQAMADRVRNTIKNRETLAKYGYSGIGLQIAAATLDVPAIAATVFTEGIAAPYIWGAKASRLARSLRGATASATTAAGIEAYLVSQNPIKDPYDILYGAAGGFLLGGAVSGVLGRTSADRQKEALLKVQQLTHEGQLQDTKNALKDRGIDTGVGAAINPNSTPVQDFPIGRKGIDERIFEAEEAAMSTFGAIRFDMTGQLLRSPIGITRKVARMLGEDAVNPSEMTADLIKTVNTKRITNKFYEGYDNNYKGWVNENNISFRERSFDKARNEFGELVSEEIELPGSSQSQYVIDAANKTRNIFKEMLEDLQKAGVKGFDNIPENPTYFTHLWSGSKIREQTKFFGKEKVEQLLKQSLLSANDTMPEDIAGKIAKGMAVRIIRREVGMDSDLSRIFSTSNKDNLKQILFDEFDRNVVSEADIESIVNRLDFSKENIPARAKRRLNFDMSASVEKNGRTLHLKDLMERNTEAVVNQYINQLQGKVALAKKGIFSNADFEKIKKDIIAEGEQFGNLKQAQKDVEKLDVLYALISGRPSPLVGNPSSTSNRLTRLLMDYNFIRVMNQVGFAQISEIGNAVSIDGYLGLIRVIPDLKGLVKRAKNGQLEDSVARDIEAFMGIGVDRNIHNAMNRFSVEDLYSEGQGGFIDKAIDFIQPVKRLTADISGLMPITVALERASAKIAVQSLVDIALGAKKIRLKRIGATTLDDDIKSKLASFGLDEDMWAKVVQQIQEHAVTSPSLFFRNRKVNAINMDAWDEDARDAFAYAVARWTRKTIQQNDVGNLNIHMTSTMGKILTQFRAFMLVSHAKQFLHNIHRRDFASFAAFMHSSMYGALGYTLQTHANAIGKKDKEKFLEERLSSVEIGKAAFARSTWAALLPGAIDTIAFATGQEPNFAYTRTTGIATDFFRGVPTVNLLDTAGRVVQGGSRSFFNEDYRWSKGQQRALNSLLPLQNAIGVRNVLELMLDGLPEDAKVDLR